MTAVYIIDDEPIVREVVSELEQDMGCAHHLFASGTAFLSALPELDPGCMLVDLCMDELSGIDLIRATADVRRSFLAVVMSGYTNIEKAVEAMKAGAIEILQKPLNIEQLKGALELASQALDQLSAHDLDDCVPYIARHYQLTGRQPGVLQALVSGKSNKQIAGQFSISTRTVEMHHAAVMAKLKIHSLPELLRLLVAATVRPGLDRAPTSRAHG